MFQAKKSKMAPKLPPAEDQNHESIQFTWSCWTWPQIWLVKLHIQYQMNYTKVGVCMKLSTASWINLNSEGSTPLRHELSERQQIISSFIQIICKQGDNGIGSCLEQSEMWNLKGRGNKSVLLGNSATAAHVSSGATSTICSLSPSWCIWIFLLILWQLQKLQLGNHSLLVVISQGLNVSAMQALCTIDVGPGSS
jgi:hypothetical protein